VLLVETPRDNAPLLDCRIWRDRVRCRDAGDEAAGMLSASLRRSVRLVYAGEGYTRKVNRDFVPGNTDVDVGLADGFPLLLMTREALTVLEDRFGQALEVARFRPNIVVSGGRPHAEDNWRSVRIGITQLRVVKPCSRCRIPALNPRTGRPTPGFNRALAAYRRIDGEILFGQNALVLSPGVSVVRVGDLVHV